MQSWYLVQFKPNAHRVAERNLVRQGFRTFLPVHRVTIRNTLKFKEKLKPLFPGYMFISVMTNNPDWRKVSSTLGVSRIVSFDGKPKAMPERLVSDIMLRCDKYGKLQPLELLESGDKVELLTGPFANYIANVEKLESSTRIWVVMEIMGQKTKIDVSKDNLRLAN